MGTPTSSAALPGAPAEHLHEPTSGPIQGPAQSFWPIAGQFILTNRRQHANPADRIKRGHLAARHQFMHSVVHAHRRHIQKEQTTPNGQATTPRGPGTALQPPGTTPLRSRTCCQQQLGTTPLRSRACCPVTFSGTSSPTALGRTQSLLNSNECIVRHQQTTYSPDTVASERTRRHATKTLNRESTVVAHRTQPHSTPQKCCLYCLP